MAPSKRSTCKVKTERGTRCTRLTVEKGCCRQHYRKIYGKNPSVKSPTRFSLAKVLAPYKGCPPGMIKRKAYSRRSFIRTSTGSPVRGSKVKAECIKDRGTKGRMWKIKNQTMGIGSLRKGDLKKHGYAFDKAESGRHEALREAIKESGSLTVLRKLNALSVYNKKRFQDRSAIYASDRDYVSNIHEKEKESM